MSVNACNLRCGKFFLPRFIIIMEYKSNFLLNESIQNMGLKKIKPACYNGASAVYKTCFFLRF